MNDPKLASAVTRYQVEKVSKKQAQKGELNDHLEPWLADIGDEIKRVREEQGASIKDVGNIMGIHNRTFIYDALRASEKRNPDVITEPGGFTGATYSDPEPDKTTDKSYTIEYFSGVARVKFSEDESYDVAVVDGTPDMPEEWADHTRERRLLYKEILSEIKANLDRIE